MTVFADKPYFVCSTCGKIDQTRNEYIENPCLKFDCWKNQITIEAVRDELGRWFDEHVPTQFSDTIFHAIPGAFPATADL